MSWRDESTFKKASALDDNEKEFLKLAKKLRDVLKLEERSNKGEQLDKTQSEKLANKDKMVKEIIAFAKKLPPRSECLEKNPDICELIPDSNRGDIDVKRQQLERKEAAEAEKRRIKEERDREERKAAIFMLTHDRAIVDMAVGPSDNLLFTCSKDCYLISWSMAQPQLKAVTTFAGHNGAVWGIDLIERKLLSGGADGKVMLWNADAGKGKTGTIASPTQTLDHGGVVRCVRWCHFGTAGRFATSCEKLGSTPTMIAIWTTVGRRFEKQLQLENAPTKANDLRWASGAKTKIFSAHDTGHVGIWWAEAPDAGGALLKVVKLHTAPVVTLFITSDNTTLVTASHDKTALAVDISSPAMATLATYRSSRPLNAAAVSDDYKGGESGTIVVGGGRDPMVITQSKLDDDEFEAKVLDSKSGEILSSGSGHFGPVHVARYMSWVGRSGAVATAAEDGTLRVHGVDGELLHGITLVK